jgi:hypothetical protein
MFETSRWPHRATPQRIHYLQATSFSLDTRSVGASSLGAKSNYLSTGFNRVVRRKCCDKRKHFIAAPGLSRVRHAPPTASKELR